METTSLLWVHDWTLIGSTANLAKEWQVKLEGILGPPQEPDCVHEIRTLNRLMTWNDTGIEWDADPRHAALIIEGLGISSGGAKILIPGAKENRGRS